MLALSCLSYSGPVHRVREEARVLLSLALEQSISENRFFYFQYSVCQGLCTQSSPLHLPPSPSRRLPTTKVSIQLCLSPVDRLTLRARRGTTS